jgi:hypothetical protein
MIEGSGSVPLTNGSGSRRPKNIQIQIRNTGFDAYPDPDRLPIVDADQHPDSNSHPKFYYVGNLKVFDFYSFSHSIASLHCFIFLTIVIGVIVSIFWL